MIDPPFYCNFPAKFRLGWPNRPTHSQNASPTARPTAAATQSRRLHSCTAANLQQARRRTGGEAPAALA